MLVQYNCELNSILKGFMIMLFVFKHIATKPFVLFCLYNSANDVKLKCATGQIYLAEHT